MLNFSANLLSVIFHYFKWLGLCQNVRSDYVGQTPKELWIVAEKSLNISENLFPNNFVVYRLTRFFKIQLKNYLTFQMM